MKQKHNGYYYVYNSSENVEKIIFLNNETFIDKLFDNESSFVLGTYLSGFMEVESGIRSTFEYDINISLLKSQCRKIIESRKDYLPVNGSEYMTQLITFVHSCIVDMMSNDYDVHKEMATLKNLCSFVDLCTEDEKNIYCNFNMLLWYANMNSIALKRGQVFIIGADNTDIMRNMEYSEVGQCLDEYLKNKRTNINKLPHIQVYKLGTMNDLILSSLQAIFSQNKRIMECKNCYRYFVPERKTNNKYCQYDLIGEDYECKKRGYIYSRKRHYSDEEIRNLYDKIRNRLYVRWNNVTTISDEEKVKRIDEYYTFLNDYNLYSKEIDDNKYTEYDLRLWLEEKERQTRIRQKK